MSLREELDQVIHTLRCYHSNHPDNGNDRDGSSDPTFRRRVNGKIDLSNPHFTSATLASQDPPLAWPCLPTNLFFVFLKLRNCGVHLIQSTKQSTLTPSSRIVSYIEGEE